MLSSARKRFLEAGYASACINDIAQGAGVSTKTVYRLFESKGEIFNAVITDRIARFNVEVDQGLLKHPDLHHQLEQILIAYGRLALDPETIAINRLAVAEADRFPEIAASFYERAIRASTVVFEVWLRSQRDKGAIGIADVSLAAGFLRGMMTMEPQRAVMLGQRQAPDDEEIRMRAAECAAIFLRGCVTASS
ncbi:AcrR family transcriptional regulator [Rhizobium sp. BK347]|nr:AcrR family transcriptional regulator [Rhizobium sp. BK252]MBB3405017.1 AcrR family transcriptional regulator [Rhizobium sp. BK289]MBB3417563.1 AcrR family transcriptional regulator [Rhizobium sp. BK284]MBB3485273.1 AcrR family transcriptional regulator [Rhizobium sp. BK347]